LKKLIQQFGSILEPISIWLKVPLIM